jgi:predicted kinase
MTPLLTQITPPYFIMMVGLSGSGKSTVSQKIYDRLSKETDVVVLSSDSIRAELLNDINDQSNNNLVFSALHKRTIDCLKNNISVIYDATNLNIKDRRGIMEQLKDINCTKIAYVMCTSFEMCKERNANRERVVPEAVIDKQRVKFSIPLYGEGFDFIDMDGWQSVLFDYNYKRLYNGYNTLSTLLKPMLNFDQKTHYHDFSLLEHEIRTYRKVLQDNNDKNKKYLLQACLVHDFGKLYTQTINKIGECSYYGHANVGAYEFLQNLDCFELETFDEVLKCLSLINYHMDMFNLEEAKITTVEKKKEVFGELYEDLLILHEADKWASKERNEYNE